MGALSTHIDNILGCGEYDLLANVRGLSEKSFGKLEVQEGSSVHVGMGLAQEKELAQRRPSVDGPRHDPVGDFQVRPYLPAELRMLDISDPAVCVTFVEGVLNFALFPDDPRPQYAVCYNCAAT